jgi:hypothetical protein
MRRSITAMPTMTIKVRPSLVFCRKCTCYEDTEDDKGYIMNIPDTDRELNIIFYHVIKEEENEKADGHINAQPRHDPKARVFPERSRPVFQQKEKEILQAKEQQQCRFCRQQPAA